VDPQVKVLVVVSSWAQVLLVQAVVVPFPFQSVKATVVWEEKSQSKLVDPCQVPVAR